MTSLRNAAGPGVRRGLIELRQSFAGTGLVGHLLWPVVTLVAIALLRDTAFGESRLAVGALILPGVLGMFVALGMLLTTQRLAADREDGTLLRARATPDGIAGYFVGTLVTVGATVLVYLVVILVPGALLVGGLEPRPGSWVGLIVVVVLGLLATQPIGILLGAIVPNARAAGPVSLLVMALVAISGIFYPIGALPDWLQATAQSFPVYWLGLGMRAALLPEGAGAIEIGGSWRPLETLLVLGAWAAIGLVLAPILVRRMARRETGSSVARRREALLQRVG
jgi:ABC-2 type transport system permease protein